jgi:hypothetical protein
MPWVNPTGTSNVNLTDLTQIAQTGDFTGLPVDVMAFAIAILQTHNSDNDISQAITGIQNRNTLLANAKQQLAAAKQLQTQAAQNGTSVMPPDMAQFYDANGIKWDHTGGDMIHNKDEWQYNIDQLQAFIDSNNSSAQIDMLNVQSLMSKRGQNLDMATSLIKKSDDTKDGIIRNV